MRPIKFRAWDKKRKKFMKVMLLHVSEEKGVFAVTLTDGKGDIPAFIDDIELLQFTGLTDCDGREIYEGDLLEGEDPNGEPIEPFEVKMEHGMWVFYDEFDSFDFTSLHWAIDAGYEFKVIGNRYTNPEMLEAP